MQLTVLYVLCIISLDMILYYIIHLDAYRTKAIVTNRQT